MQFILLKEDQAGTVENDLISEVQQEEKENPIAELT